MRNHMFVERGTDVGTVQRLLEDVTVSPLVAKILVARGMTKPDEVKSIWNLEPSLSDPLRLPDMQMARDRIRDAVKSGARIRVYGDYDADGVTATAVLVRGLELMDAEVDYYIPNRFDEGYGLHPDAVQAAYEDGIDLMVTVDCGTSSPDAADLARDLGVGLVITDHHGLPGRLPEALALVNPERQDPVDRLSGAGVALQLVRALLGEEVPLALLGIAAIGTVADVVPLTGNNRALVVAGLRALRQGHVPGIRQLMAGEGRDLTHVRADDLGFFVGPRLNAAGRMGDASVAVELLLAQDDESARVPADGLRAANAERRRLEREILAEAYGKVPVDADGRLYDFIAVAGENWHEGVIGIVASRLMNQFRRPVAVISWHGDAGKGSARGVEGLHLLQHLRQHPELFLTLGGHPMAAGFSLRRRSSEELCQIWSKDVPDAARGTQRRGMVVDGALPATAFTPQLLEELRRLEPFGHGFERPRFLIEGVVREARTMGDGSHLSLTLEGSRLRAVAFGHGHYHEALRPGVPIRLVASVEFSTFRGQERAEWRVEAIDGVSPQSERRIIGLSQDPDFGDKRRIVVVDSQRDQSRTVPKAGVGARSYDTRRPVGELIYLEEEAKRGTIVTLVVSQWRPLPRLYGWADEVIWLTMPHHPRILREAGALLKPDGVHRLDPTGDADRVLAKARRLQPNRLRLGMHWRSWSRGRPGLVIGRTILRELHLDPSMTSVGEKHPLQQSFSYQRALWDQSQDVSPKVNMEQERGY